MYKKRKNSVNDNCIKLKITTQSNVLLGGADQGFEIGGIDKSTVLDFNGKPFIPASAFKGMLRKIMKENDDQAMKVIIAEFLEKDKKSLIEDLGRVDKADVSDRKKAIDELYNKVIEQVSPANLLGIDRIQRMPKLLFEDFQAEDGQEEMLIIDTKNTVEETGQEVSAKPRTYRVIRKGAVFQGEILLYDYDRFDDKEKIVEYVVEMLMMFNQGIYRIGNSKSRGYGKINVEVINLAAKEGAGI